MKELRESIEPLIQEELARANKRFPQFHSAHEGYAVLKEEIEEAGEELDAVIAEISMLWTLVKGNDPAWMDVRADRIKKSATDLAAEAIQVAAMAQKFMDMMEREDK